MLPSDDSQTTVEPPPHGCLLKRSRVGGARQRRDSVDAAFGLSQSGTDCGAKSGGIAPGNPEGGGSILAFDYRRHHQLEETGTHPLLDDARLHP